MTNLTTVLCHYWPRRRQYIQRILASIQGKKILWNNSSIPIGGAINANKNYGVISKIAVAVLADTDYILQVDDDLIIPPQTVRTMYDFCQKNPTSLVGIIGKNIAQTKHPYTDGETIFATNEPRETDIVVGRAIMYRKDLLQHFFKKIRTFTNEDDVYFSLINKLQGNENYIIKGEWQNLDEYGEGLSHQPTHLETRDQICLQFM